MKLRTLGLKTSLLCLSITMFGVTGKQLTTTSPTPSSTRPREETRSKVPLAASVGTVKGPRKFWLSERNSWPIKLPGSRFRRRIRRADDATPKYWRPGHRPAVWAGPVMRVLRGSAMLLAAQGQLSKSCAGQYGECDHREAETCGEEHRPRLRQSLHTPVTHNRTEREGDVVAKHRGERPRVIDAGPSYDHEPGQGQYVRR
jgi:hypothetical protein